MMPPGADPATHFKLGPGGLSDIEWTVQLLQMRHAGRVVTRTMLLEAVWDYRFDPQTNIIDQHVSRLRQNLAR